MGVRGLIGSGGEGGPSPPACCVPPKLERGLGLPDPAAGLPPPPPPGAKPMAAAAAAAAMALPISQDTQLGSGSDSPSASESRGSDRTLPTGELTPTLAVELAPLARDVPPPRLQPLSQRGNREERVLMINLRGAAGMQVFNTERGPQHSVTQQQV